MGGIVILPEVSACRSPACILCYKDPFGYSVLIHIPKKVACELREICPPLSLRHP